MPWDASRIVVADPTVRTRAWSPAVTASVLGSPGSRRCGAPRLAFVSDRDRWLNVTVADPDGGRRAVVAVEAHEHAEPTWSPGQRSFAWSPDGTRLAWCRNEDGFGRLVVAPVDARQRGRGALEGLAPWARLGPARDRRGAVGLDGHRRRSSWSTPMRRVARSWVSTPAASIPTRSSSRRRSRGARPTAPMSTDCSTDLTPRASAPFLAMLHGGPTDQARVDWDTRVAEFVDRGWTVFAPNPRGSTGYGRAYAQALTHAWGVVDVADAIAGIEAAIERRWADPGRIALHGSSAGGFTALLVAAAAPELVRAVAATYPVTNLVTLAEHTHRFESRYNDMLVGPLPAAADEYDAARRSPRVATSPRPSCSCRGPTTASCRPPTPSRSPTRCAPPAAT